MTYNKCISRQTFLRRLVYSRLIYRSTFPAQLQFLRIRLLSLSSMQYFILYNILLTCMVIFHFLVAKMKQLALIDVLIISNLRWCYFLNLQTITTDNSVSRLHGYRSRGIIYAAISDINLIAGPIITRLTFDLILPISIHPDDPGRSISCRRFYRLAKSHFRDGRRMSKYKSLGSDSRFIPYQYCLEICQQWRNFCVK